MVLLNAAYLPPGSVIGSPLASSPRWGDRFPPAHSDWHAAQDLGSTCPLTRFRSFKNAADVHKPSVGARDGYSYVVVPRPPFRVVKCPTAISARRFCLLPRTPLYIPVGRFRRGS